MSLRSERCWLTAREIGFISRISILYQTNENHIVFCFFAVARSACLRVRSLGRNQHSALVACGLPLLFSPAVWHFVRKDAGSTLGNIDNILQFLILFNIVLFVLSQLPVRHACECARSIETSILRSLPAVCSRCFRLRYGTSFGQMLNQHSKT